MRDEPIRFLPLVSAAELARKEPPPLLYVDGHRFFPQGELSILSGAGAAGKTTAMMQLAIAVASRAEASYWLGKPVEDQGSVLFYSAEERLGTLHHKLFEIGASDPSIDLTRLDRLKICDFSMHDEEKALLVSKGGRVNKTPTFKGLEQAIVRHEMRLVIIDHRAHIALIDEIKKNDATATISALRSLAMIYDCAIILLQHPSLSGTKTGNSGSVGFMATSRNFVYMRRPDDKEADEVDGEDDGKRILRGEKVNAGKMGRIINLQWDAGAYRCTDEPPRAGSDIGKADRAERVFLRLLAQFTARGLRVSNNPKGIYAPTEFTKRGVEREGVNRREFEEAMNRLIDTGRIIVEVLFPGTAREKSRLKAATED